HNHRGQSLLGQAANAFLPRGSPPIEFHHCECSERRSGTCSFGLEPRWSPLQTYLSKETVPSTGRGGKNFPNKRRWPERGRSRAYRRLHHANSQTCGPYGLLELCSLGLNHLPDRYGSADTAGRPQGKDPQCTTNRPPTDRRKINETFREWLATTFHQRRQ